MLEGAPESESPLPDDLDRWVAADLITTEQARRIARFEGERRHAARSGRASRAVALLGALTVVSGFGSLVAYNWDRLSDVTKLVGLGVLLCASLALTFRTHRAGSHLAPGASSKDGAEGDNTALDVWTLISSGLTLTGLSLVSQIYHQDGEVWQLLFVWSATTAPLMSFTRTRFAHIFWYLALFISLVSSGDAASDFLRESLSHDTDHAAFTILLTFGTLSVLLAERFAASRHPGRAWVGRSFVSLLLMVLGLFGGLFWFHGDDAKPLFWVLGGLSFGTIFVAAPPSLSQLGWGSAKQVKLLFGLGIALAVLPMGLPFESGFAAFVSFLIFWGLAWYIAEQAGATRSARLAVFVIGARVVIASFELFESLLVTGGVLVGLGGLALAWSRHSLKQVTEKEAAHG